MGQIFSREDFDEGYAEGYKAGESAGNRKAEDLTKLLQAAKKVIEAYGEDEGYSPSRVTEEIRLLTKAGL